MEAAFNKKTASIFISENSGTINLAEKDFIFPYKIGLSIEGTGLTGWSMEEEYFNMQMARDLKVPFTTIKNRDLQPYTFLVGQSMREDSNLERNMEKVS